MSLPPEPWTLLGLDAGAATERDVKRAYARLLKQHRPDTDPEGFQQVHAAYQFALHVLSNRDDDDVPAGEAVPAAEQSSALADGAAEQPHTGENEVTMFPAFQEPPPAAPPELPAPFVRAAEQLRLEAKRKDLPSSRPAFAALKNQVRVQPHLAEAWGHALADIYGGELEKLSPLMEPADIMLLLHAGHDALARDMLLLWREDPALLNRITRTAALLLQKEGSEAGSMEHLRRLHFVASISAFYAPEAAEKIANELFRQLGPGVREEAVRSIELRVAAGTHFTRLSHADRRFWEHCLFESGDEEKDWTTPRSKNLLRTLTSFCPRNWEGWPLIAAVVPENVLRPLLETKAPPAKTASRRHSSGSSRSAGSSGKKFPIWACVWILFILVKLVMVGVRSNSNSHSSYPVPNYNFDSSFRSDLKRTSLKDIESLLGEEHRRGQTGSTPEKRTGLEVLEPPSILPPARSGGKIDIDMNSSRPAELFPSGSSSGNSPSSSGLRF